MIKVANIVEEAKLGGPQVRIANVARALKESAETVVIMPAENSTAFRKKLDGQGVTYKLFKISRITKEFSVAARYLFFSWLEIFQLTNYFKKSNFDLIHISGGSWQFKGLIAGKLAGNKVVWHLNDTSMPWFIRAIFFLLRNRPDAYIFASERSREYYRTLLSNNKQEFIIPAPVDTRVFQPDSIIEGDENLIEKWKGKTIIGTVANINPVKGLDMFVRVAAALNKQNDNLQFVVIGSVSDNQKKLFNNLKSIADELEVKNMHFSGPREDPRAILQRMDMYLCTSNAESSPIAVWEAMSMAKPIVSTDVGDVAKYVNPGKSGEIVKVGDESDMTKKVISLIHDKARMASYADEARRIAVEKLDIRNCAENHLNAYKKILES